MYKFIFKNLLIFNLLIFAILALFTNTIFNMQVSKTYKTNKLDILIRAINDIENNNTENIYNNFEIELIQACQNNDLDKLILLNNTNNYLDTSENNIINYIQDKYVATFILNAQFDYNINLVRSLKEKEEIDKQDQSGKTELIKACQNNNIELLQCLVSNGASTEISDNLNNTVFDYADKKITDMIKYLKINSNIYQNLYKERYKSILDYAIKCLLKQVDDKFIKLLKTVTNINSQDSLGRTILIVACQYANLDLIKLIISNNPDINIKDNDNKTALDYAKNNNKKVYKFLESLTINPNSDLESDLTSDSNYNSDDDYDYIDGNNTNSNQKRILLEDHIIKAETKASKVMDMLINKYPALSIKIGKHRYKCTYPGCNYKAISISRVRCHMSSHSDKRFFECQNCHCKFKQKWSLKTHRCTSEEYCEEQIPAESLRYEKQIIKDLIKKYPIKKSGYYYRCGYNNCSRKHENLQACKLHYMTHTDARPFQCTLCKATFKRRNALQRHNKICNAHNN